MKLVVHDGFGLWWATRSLNQGRFIWASLAAQLELLTRTLTQAQFESWSWACRDKA
jgi:hypothetical protein